jgi:hypothetical protein
MRMFTAKIREKAFACWIRLASWFSCCTLIPLFRQDALFLRQAVACSSIYFSRRLELRFEGRKVGDKYAPVRATGRSIHAEDIDHEKV